MYEYRATISRHIDGDTTIAGLQLGLDVDIKTILRWYGINAPERFTPEGKAATAAVNQMLPVGAVCTVHTYKDDKREKYGRYLATFVLDDGANLNQWMIDQGHAVPFMVGGAKEANA